MFKVKKINRYIEIVASSNPELNAMSKSTRQSIYEVLRKHYLKVEVTILDNMDDLKDLVAKKPDLVVLGMKRLPLGSSTNLDKSHKIWLTSYLKANSISFAGSGTTALASEFDKPVAKQMVLAAGLKTAGYFISDIDKPTYGHSLGYPLFVKPTNLGNSKGIDEYSLVNSQSELKSKIKAIHKKYSTSALIEEFLPGREFSVAVVENPISGLLETMPIEITTSPDANGNSFLSKIIKRSDAEKVYALDDQLLSSQVSELALGVFEALGASDYGRIDMRLDIFGQPSFIEANLMPGLSNHGYLSRCFHLNSAIDYEHMIMLIVKLGLKKNHKTINFDSLDYLSKTSLPIDDNAAAVL